MSDFDREIERELGRALGQARSASVPSWKAPVSRATVRKVIGGTGVAFSAKLAAGFAVAALAATGATEATVTGSFNPTVWGQQVKQQVADCKGALTPGQHGIGACVSDFAQQKAQPGAAKAAPTPRASAIATTRSGRTSVHTRDHRRDGSTGAGQPSGAGGDSSTWQDRWSRGR